jgi:tape measure domain-containing protein
MANNDLKITLSGDGKGLQLAIADASVSLVNLGLSAKQAAAQVNSAMGRATTDTSRLNKELDTSQGLMGKLGAAAAGIFSTVAIVAMYKEAATLSLAMERYSNTLKFASGSSAAFAANTAFLQSTVRSLGLDLQSSSQQFASLTAAAKGTSLEGAGARSIFDAVGRAATVMGLSADQTSGSLLAISQMISKGTVSAEELRGQLGERLPGAFQIAARAMGVTTQELGKMLEQGALATDVFLPRFAAQMRQELGGSVEAAADSVQANLNRVKTDWANLVVVVNNSAFTNESLKGIDEFLIVLTGTLKKSGEDFKGWGESVANTLAFVGDAATSAIGVIKAVGNAYGGAAALAGLYVKKQSDIDTAGFYADRDQRVAAIEANYAAASKAIKDGVAEQAQTLVNGSSKLPMRRLPPTNPSSGG